MGAYENPITYVDTESAKYYAGAISQIGQVGAKLITDETERRRKEDEENKLRNEKRQQRFKKYQLETQSNVNDALKTLDFSENESFRKGMGNIIDEYALAKSAYEFENDPAKSKELGNKIFKMDSFFKKSFGSEMDDLMADVEMYKKVQNNAGNEGGISKYMDSNYGTLLQYMANNTDPGNLDFEFDVDSGDIILVLSGKDESGEDLYTGPGVKDGVYKVSLKGNQSSELPVIPEVNLRKSNGKSKTGEKLPSTLQNIGVYNAKNQVPAKYYDEKVTETKLDNGNIITQFTFNDLGKSVIKKEIEAEVIGLLTAGDGPAQGVKSANSLYQNVLEPGKTLDASGSFVLNGQNIPITKESFDLMVDKLTKREVEYVQNNMPIQTTKMPTDNDDSDKDISDVSYIDEIEINIVSDIGPGEGKDRKMINFDELEMQLAKPPGNFLVKKAETIGGRESRTISKTVKGQDRQITIFDNSTPKEIKAQLKYLETGKSFKPVKEKESFEGLDFTID